MNNYFEKMYYWDEFLFHFSKEKLNFIGNSNTEERSDNNAKVLELNETCKCAFFYLKYDYDRDVFEYEENTYDLKRDTYMFFEKMNKDIPLMLNITSMNLRFMGTLLFNIKKIGFTEVYCLYTEPSRYCKNVDNSDGGEMVDKFDLYKRFRGVEPIPGLLRANDDKLKEKWIAFLGFDGKRAEQINDRYEFTDIVPVVTLPSYKPGWHNYALQENIDLIKSIERKPEYIIANSFLSAYMYLEKMKETYPDTYLRVTPLGTKINALGAVLFCLKNKENIEILYDNPNEEGKISTECGKTYIFDISEFL